MNTVKDILDQKGSNVWSVSPTESLLNALRKMKSHNVGALLVLEGSTVRGIISERDFAGRIAETGTCPLEQEVALWMTREVIVVNPENSINECMQLMSREHIRHLPVVEGENLVGLISIGDVVRAVISGQQSTILGLENYILSRNFAL